MPWRKSDFERRAAHLKASHPATVIREGKLLMTPNESRIAEAAEWIARAQADLQAAEVLQSAGLYAEALYHSQQCAEKALKGMLTRHNRLFRKTHDLEELAQSCITINPAFAEAAYGIEVLSRYAWQFRYPGAPYIPPLRRQTVSVFARDFCLKRSARYFFRSFPSF